MRVREVSGAAGETPESREKRADVENNGGYYVRVGETVYFRRYGADALPKTSLFGGFTESWGAGGECELMAYERATGTLRTVCAENGTGPLWYGDGGFYLHERYGGSDFVVWYSLDGESRETICRGEPLSVTESGLLAVKGYTLGVSYGSDYLFYRDKKRVGACAGQDDYLTFAGLTDDGVFVLAPADVDGDRVARTLRQLTPDGKEIDLGALPETAYQDPLYDVQADRFLAADGKVAVGVGYYAGTGHFLTESVMVRATAGAADSLEVIEVSDETDDHACLWLQEAEIIGDWEDGSSVWRAKPGAPCAAYPISGADALQSLRACRDPEFPMAVFNVTVDDEGVVQSIVRAD